MWAWLGLGCSVLGATCALGRSRSRTPSFYESEVYGMTRTSHLRFALLSLAFAIAFAGVAVAALFPTSVPIALLAFYAVPAILYGASFVRGATGEDE
jgi:hypothetical protein